MSTSTAFPFEKEKAVPGFINDVNLPGSPSYILKTERRRDAARNARNRWLQNTGANVVTGIVICPWCRGHRHLGSCIHIHVRSRIFFHEYPLGIVAYDPGVSSKRQKFIFDRDY